MENGNTDRKIYGYVVHIVAKATAVNHTYGEGTINVMYGGAGKLFLGDEEFEPYKSEESAKRGRKSWDKYIGRLDAVAGGWKHQIGDVMPVTEAMYTEIEEQQKRNFEIIRKRKIFV